MKSWLLGKNHYLQYVIFIIMAIFFIFVMMELIYRNAWKITNPDVLWQAAIAMIIIMGIWLILWVLKKENWMLLFLTITLVMTRELVALGGIILFVWGGFSIGSWILSKFLEYKNDLKYQIISFFVGMSINAYFIWIFMHFQMNYWWVYLLFLIGEILLFRKYWLTIFKSFDLKNIKFGWSDRIVLLFILFFIPYIITETYNWDDIVKHLTIPKQIAMFGIFDFDPRFVISLDTSIIPQSNYVTGYVIAGETMVRMINFLMFVLSWLLLNEKLKKYSQKIASIGLLITILSPFVLWQIGVVFIDSFNLFSGVVLFIIFWELIKKLDGKKIILFFIIAGFAFLCKQQAVFLIVPMSCWLFIEILWYKRAYIKHFFFGGLISSVLIGIFLSNNYLITKNPFYPWYNGVFESEYMSAENVGTMWKVDHLGLNTLYQLSFEGDKFIENHPYSFGLIYIFLLWSLAVLFLDWKKEKEKLKILIIFLSACLLWIFLTGPYIRYFVAIAPIGAVLIAFSFEKIINIFQIKFFKIVAWSILGIILISNLIFMLGMYYVPSVYPWQSFRDQNFKTSMYTSVENVLKEAGKKFGKDSKGLLIESPALYFADTHIETVYWYHQKNFDEIIGAKLEGDALSDQIFDKMGFDYIVVPKSTQFKVFLDDEFTKFTKQIFEEGNFVLITKNAEE